MQKTKNLIGLLFFLGLVSFLSLSFVLLEPVGVLPGEKTEENISNIYDDKIEIGLELYSVREQVKSGVEQTLSKVSAIGFKEVEVAGYYDLPVEEYKKLLDKNNLKPKSALFSYERFQTDIENIAKEAAILGIKYVGCAWIPHKDSFTIEDAKKAVNDFNNFGEKLKAKGIRFFYHTHGYEFAPYEKGTLFDFMMANTKPENVAFEMDVFWVAHPGQDPVKILEKYSKRFELLHLKDMQKGVKGNLTGHADVETNVVIGSGQIDFPAIMKTAKKIGIKNYFIEDESSRVMEQLPGSLKYLNSLK